MSIDIEKLPPINRPFLEANVANLNISALLRDELTQHESSHVKISTTPNGFPVMALHGQDIYDFESPFEKVKTQVAMIEAEDDPSVVVLFGLGLGYHAELLERRFNSKVVVCDPSLDALQSALGARFLPLNRTHVISNPVHLLGEIQTSLQFTDHKIVVAAIPAYQQLFYEEFERFRTVLEQAVSNANILESTIGERSPNWIRHSVANSPKALSRPSIDCLGSRFANKPGILVSAGPSLDNNIELLRKAKGHALILAVNAAVGPLCKAGVIPDIVAIVEGLDLRAQLDDLEPYDQVALAPTINSFPGFFDIPARHVFAIPDFSTPCSDWFTRAFGWSRVPSGGSVACSGFSMLLKLGCNPIVLVGQDLAYTDGKSYVSTATFGRQLMRYDEETQTLNAEEEERNPAIESIREEGGLDQLLKLKATQTEAYGGKGTVYMTTMFALFKSWFETVAQTWAKECTLVNATEGGARIKNFEEMPLEAVIDRWCRDPVPAMKWIDEAVDEAPCIEGQALADIIRQDLEIISHMGDLARKTCKAAKTARRKLKKKGLTAAERSIERLSRLETELKDVSKKNQILNAFVAGEVNRLRVGRSQDTDNDPVLQAVKSIRRSEKVFAAIFDGADELVGMFKLVIEKLESLEPLR